jgi:Tfp pilus assembly protein PilW
MEMMVAIVVASVVLGAATTLVGGVASLTGTTDRQVIAQENARTAIDTLATQLRNAVGPPGQSPVYYPAAGSSGGTTEVVFYAPNPSANTTNNPRGLQWIRYCLDYSNVSNETLWFQTAAYDSTQSVPPLTTTCPSASWTTQRSVATNVVNRAATPVTTLFTQGSDSSGVIHDMQVRLLVQGDSKRQVTPVTSSIDFRNAKSGPSAVVTCQVQNGHAVCDGSKSTDPDGEALSFKWGRQCCSSSYSTSDTRWETGQTSYLFDSGSLASGTHKVWVRVGDASGLTTDASTTVTIP